MALKKIVSGGQTGADRAALDVAISSGFPHGGWAPEGRYAEDGVIPVLYCLKELTGKGYAERTERNVVDSDATLIFSHGVLFGGSALTHQYATLYEKPCLHLDLDKLSNEDVLQKVLLWLSKNSIQVLNVAGPRAGDDPEIYTAVRTLLAEVVANIKGGL